MTHYYKITFSRKSPKRTRAHRERRVVAPALEQAIERARALAEQTHPGAIVIIEGAHIYDHAADKWERIALYDREE